VAGEFVDLDGERFYAIRNVDRMPPFLVSVVSSGDHWLFASSNGGLSRRAGFPRYGALPLHHRGQDPRKRPHTGPRTLIRVEAQGKLHVWEPFNREQDGVFEVSRHLYKNVRGNKLCFEEINHELGAGIQLLLVDQRRLRVRPPLRNPQPRPHGAQARSARRAAEHPPGGHATFHADQFEQSRRRVQVDGASRRVGTGALSRSTPASPIAPSPASR
jgi:hypothetical protein